MGIRHAVPVLLALLSFVANAQAAERPWSFSASGFLYIVPEDADYLQPTITADRGKLHLESRYNYEDLETGSLWAGYNLSGGGDVSIQFTPMIGGVFGATDGIAPGCHITLDWRSLEFYSEGEYLFDAGDREDSFFYAWSELTASPSDRFRAGLVVQRTRAYEGPREFQRGMLAGFTMGSAELAGYVFNPDDTRPLCVVSLSAGF